ncbi:hypothetical protein CPB86DRAFT_792227 [Serendipita vermifera]|nr:hypothetical protein CPB86DRAFT_792227 [Serendipita vermifera]
MHDFSGHIVERGVGQQVSHCSFPFDTYTFSRTNLAQTLNLGTMVVPDSIGDGVGVDTSIYEYPKERMSTCPNLWVPRLQPQS